MTHRVLLDQRTDPLGMSLRNEQSLVGDPLEHETGNASSHDKRDGETRPAPAAWQNERGEEPNERTRRKGGAKQARERNRKNDATRDNRHGSEDGPSSANDRGNSWRLEYLN